MLVVLFCGLRLSAQQRVVVADADSHAPISHASLYTKVGGRFRSVITDDEGRAEVAFDFGRLTVSHLNYEQRVVTRLGDTLFLRPRFRSTAEVVVTNEEPAWIRQKLKQVVKTKAARYFTSADTAFFDYETQSMGRDRIYRYRLTGLLRMRERANDRYAFLADGSSIVASDSTQLTDVQNLRRMLYEDFVDELDNGFIRQHRWRVNPDFVGTKEGEVELTFRSKHRNDDRGRVVIDTVRCVIVEASRVSGTKTNIEERIPAMLYGISRMLTGYKVEKWQREYRVAYGERPDGTFYPREVRYKSFDIIRENSSDAEEREYYEQTGGGFPNMEAVLTIRRGTEEERRGLLWYSNIQDRSVDGVGCGMEDGRWEELPPSWYIRLSSDSERRREIELSGMEATFTLYEELEGER